MHNAATADPGPLARFKHIAAQPETMSIIVQRITDAENPETLKDIAKAWQIPHGKLAEWITENRGRTEQYLNALRISADSYIHEVVPIADGTHPGALPTAAERKLQVEARTRVAGMWDRNRFDARTSVHVDVHDDRPQLEREQALLEAARAVGFMLATADILKRERELNPLLPAPETEDAAQQSAETTDESGLI